MATVSLTNIKKHFGSTRLFEGVNLQIEKVNSSSLLVPQDQVNLRCCA